jgi:CubicO group peptidase (beta-lactamase class C family)
MYPNNPYKLLQKEGRYGMQRPLPASLLLVLLPLLLLANSCHLGRFVAWNAADINDYKKFPSRPVASPAQAFHFIEAQENQALKMPKEIRLKKNTYIFEEALEKSGTVSFLVIRNDSLLYEKYFDRYEEASIIPSFSVAKSFVSALVGIAVAEGHIKSVDEPVTRYLKDLDEEKFGRITIEHLLDMRSGIRYNEGYLNPFGDVAKYYYGLDLKKYVGKHGIRQAPGQSFDYISLNTQLLGLILEAATGQTLDAYLQEKIWRPLGMEYDASWSIDSRKNGTIKAFCCINARARDFAKLGRLYLQGGAWNGRQIVPEAWVRRSTVFDRDINSFRYTYQWWHTVDATPYDENDPPAGLHRLAGNRDGTQQVIRPASDFYALGVLGQLVYVHPEKQLVIVRLGKMQGLIEWAQLARLIAQNN